MSIVYNLSSQLIPSCIIALTTFIYDLSNYFKIDDKILYIDMLINILTFLISRYIVYHISDKIALSDVMFQYYADILTEPLCNGLILALIYKYGFVMASITYVQNSIYSYKYKRINPFEFSSGFYKGVINDLIANYLYSPTIKTTAL